FPGGGVDGKANVDRENLARLAGALSAAARDAFAAEAYQGETLNFKTPAAFFSRLTDKRWAMLYALAPEKCPYEAARLCRQDLIARP
ncbi:MAG: hypothetical protein IPQ01_18195, partial [Zoogloea sp.]|nr:hypothetical protein [Zoogloea sp.]